MSLLNPKRNYVEAYTPTQAAAKIVGLFDYDSKYPDVSPLDWCDDTLAEIQECYNKLIVDKDLPKHYPDYYRQAKDMLDREHKLLISKRNAINTYARKIKQEIRSHIEIDAPTPLKIRFKRYDPISGYIDTTSSLLTISSLYEWCKENRIETNSFNPEGEPAKYKEPPKSKISVRGLELWFKENKIDTNVFSTNKEIERKKNP